MKPEQKCAGDFWGKFCFSDIDMASPFTSLLFFLIFFAWNADRILEVGQPSCDPEDDWHMLMRAAHETKRWAGII